MDGKHLSDASSALTFMQNILEELHPCLWNRRAGSTICYLTCTMTGEGEKREEERERSERERGREGAVGREIVTINEHRLHKMYTWSATDHSS